jgi:hypothetical protein
MNITKINNKIIIDFLNQENIAEKKQAYFLDVIRTLNPSNNLYKSRSTAKYCNEINHQVSLKISYKFTNNQSAKLFSLLFKHLILNNQFLLSIKVVKSFVLIKFKNDILVEHREKFSREEETILKMENSFAYREESKIISEIFLNTVKVLFFSDIYQNEEKHKDIVNYRVIKEVEKSLDDRIDYLNGNVILKNIYSFTKEIHEKEEIIEYGFIATLYQDILDFLFKLEKEEVVLNTHMSNKYL